VIPQGDWTDDMPSALESGPWTWQSSQFYSESSLGYNPYYRFCDYVEVSMTACPMQDRDIHVLTIRQGVWPGSTNKVPGPEGVGRCQALDNYAKWFKEESLPGSMFPHHPHLTKESSI
jgi:hypothetical protein